MFSDKYFYAWNGIKLNICVRIYFVSPSSVKVSADMSLTKSF